VRLATLENEIPLGSLAMKEGEEHNGSELQLLSTVLAKQNVACFMDWQTSLRCSLKCQKSNHKEEEKSHFLVITVVKNQEKN